jgi:signal peptidase II
MRRYKNYWFWVVATIAILLDHLTKFWVVKNFQLTNPADTWAIIPNVFHFTYVVNTGAAFSLFSNGGVNWLKWLSLIVSLALMLWALYGPRFNLWEQLGYGFILGGAFGNGIDRFLAGHVVDFLDFRLINFPIFNLADVFINIGIACLLINTLREEINSPPAP